MHFCAPLTPGVSRQLRIFSFLKVACTFFLLKSRTGEKGENDVSEVLCTREFNQKKVRDFRFSLGGILHQTKRKCMRIASKKMYFFCCVFRTRLFFFLKKSACNLPLFPVCDLRFPLTPVTVTCHSSVPLPRPSPPPAVRAIRPHPAPRTLTLGQLAHPQPLNLAGAPHCPTSTALYHLPSLGSQSTEPGPRTASLSAPPKTTSRDRPTRGRIHEAHARRNVGTHATSNPLHVAFFWIRCCRVSSACFEWRRDSLKQFAIRKKGASTRRHPELRTAFIPPAIAVEQQPINCRPTAVSPQSTEEAVDRKWPSTYRTSRAAF